MIGKTARIEKYMLLFSEKLHFWWGNYDFIEFFGEKLSFLCDFDNFDASIGCATQFHADEIYIYFLSLLVEKF